MINSESPSTRQLWCSSWPVSSLFCTFSPGSLVVERGPGRPPITNHQTGPRAEAPTGVLSAAQQRQSTLAQLQMQVGFLLLQSFWSLNRLICFETKNQIRAAQIDHVAVSSVCHTTTLNIKRLFLCSRWTSCPSSPTGSLLQTTGPGTKMPDSQDPLVLHPQPDLSMEAPPLLKAPPTWSSRDADTETPNPTLEAPHPPYFKTQDSQPLRWVSAHRKTI